MATTISARMSRLRFAAIIVGFLGYSKSAWTRASTSSITTSGADSIHLAPRASRSTVRIWLHRTTSCVSVPEPLNGTAKPAYRAKSPPGRDRRNDCKVRYVISRRCEDQRRTKITLLLAANGWIQVQAHNIWLVKFDPLQTSRPTGCIAFHSASSVGSGAFKSHLAIRSASR